MAEDELTGEELPPMPAFAIARTLSYRDRLYQLGCFQAMHNVVAGDVFHALVRLLHNQLPPGIPEAALRETALVLLNQELTPAAALEFCWRVAGNIDALRSGRPAHSWTGSNDRTWAPMEVLEAHNDRTASGRRQVRTRLRVLAGPACPTVVHKAWSIPHFKFLASEAGFERYRPDQPCLVYDDPLQLVGLRFVGLIEPVRRGEAPLPRFRVVKVPGSFRAFNKARLTARQKKPCQYGYRHECHRCVVGYDRCDLATHPETFTTRPCAQCGKQDALTDPRRPEVCLACHAAALRR